MAETTIQTIRRPLPASVPSGMTFEQRNDQLKESLKFGLGGCACQESWELPANYDLDALRCHYDRLPQAISVAGASAARVTIQPTIGSNYFCPVAWLATVKDSVDPQLARSVRITDVTIGPCTLLPFSNTAPVAGTLQFIDSDELDPAARDNCACPTPNWPCFSTAALNCQLIVTIFNANPAGITAIVNIEVLGRSLSSCLDWKTAAKQRSAAQMPPSPNSAMPMP
jgi:hypothetical protein